MRAFIRRRRALRLAAILWPTELACGQVRNPPNLVARYAGCYSIETIWSDSTDGPTIERRIWLTTSQLADSAAPHVVFAVRPARNESASGFAATYWAPVNDSTLLVVWNSGFNGVSMRLKRDRSNVWKGVAQTFSDVVGARQKTGEVTGRALSCE